MIGVCRLPSARASTGTTGDGEGRSQPEHGKLPQRRRWAAASCQTEACQTTDAFTRMRETDFLSAVVKRRCDLHASNGFVLREPPPEINSTHGPSVARAPCGCPRVSGRILRDPDYRLVQPCKKHPSVPWTGVQVPSANRYVGSRISCGVAAHP